MELMLTWINARGREVPDDEIAGYNAHDFFKDGGLEQAKCLLGEDQKVMAEDFLNKTYKGPDSDGIGLRWTLY